jgi:predicted GIY-YIG superfamily endonuclease
VFRDVWRALEREKSLKGIRRRRKLDLIDASNPAWRDLSDEI